MGLATDIIQQAQTQVTQRMEIERTWENICKMMFLSPDRQWRRGTVSGSRDTFEGWATGSKVAEKARLIYDITGVIGLERIGAGLTSLVTPDNEKWESLTVDDPFGHEMSDAEVKWAEKQRDYLFKTRYDPRSGWALANQSAILSAAALGTGLYLTEENYGRPGSEPRSIPFRSTPLPLSDNYLTIDSQGLHDQDYRFMSLPARVAAQMFSGLSSKTMQMANDPEQQHRLVQFIHYIGERREKGPRKNAYAADEKTPGNYNRNSRYVSCYIEVDAKLDVKHGGFSYWPVIVYLWKQIEGSPYGDGAAALVMAEVLSANILAKNAMLAAQSQVAPAVATIDDSGMNRPNLNPRAINYGLLDKNGNLKVKPIFQSGNPQLSQQVLEASRQQIDKGLYVNLWQIMMNDPQKTATQSLIEANEKGELLGPIGTRLQAGLSRETDAELAIIRDKGAWEPGSPLAPPESIIGRATQSKFQSPLDRLRRTGELLGIHKTLELAGLLVQLDPNSDVMDNIDTDETLRIAREIGGAPAKIMRDKEAREAKREEREQASQMAAAQAAASTAKDAAQAAAAVAPHQDNLGEMMSTAGDMAQAMQQPAEAA
jgi:hypothetical protein